MRMDMEPCRFGRAVSGVALASVFIGTFVLGLGVVSQGRADSYEVIAPPTMFAAENAFITVVVHDAQGGIKADYCGTSSFSSTDPAAKIENVAMDVYNYTWSSSVAPGTCGVPPFPNGVKIFKVLFDTLGSQVITVVDTYNLVTPGTATFTVNPDYVQVATSVVVLPASASIVKSTSLPLTAQVHDQYGRIKQESVTWSVVSGGGSVNSTGSNSATYTAPNKAGTAVVRACSTSAPSVCGQSTITITSH